MQAANSMGIYICVHSLFMQQGTKTPPHIQLTYHQILKYFNLKTHQSQRIASQLIIPNIQLANIGCDTTRTVPSHIKSNKFKIFVFCKWLYRNNMFKWLKYILSMIQSHPSEHLYLVVRVAKESDPRGIV